MAIRSIAAVGLAIGVGMAASITIDSEAVAAELGCGAKNERPCRVWERIPSCDSGLVEDFALDKCVVEGSSHAPPPSSCGGKNKRPCKVWERLPSCNKNLVENLTTNKCEPKSTSKPECGKNGQRACVLWERIPSCDDGLKEKGGKCAPLAPGEKAFFAGMAATLEPLGDCDQLLKDIPRADLSWEPVDEHSLPPACYQEMYRGMLCAIPEMLAHSADFASKTATEYDRKPCSELWPGKHRLMCAAVLAVTREVGGAMKCVSAGMKEGAFDDFMNTPATQKIICKEMGSMLVTTAIGAVSGGAGMATRLKATIEALKAAVKVMSAAKTLNRTSERLAQIPECGGKSIAAEPGQLPKTVSPGSSVAPLVPMIMD